MEKELRAAVQAAAAKYFDEVYGAPKDLSYIPASGKLLDKQDLANMIDATLDMWLTAGRFNDRFEQDFAAFLGVKFALSTNSGSSANLLALSALTSYKLGERRLQKGDEVISVAAGFPTTVNPIIQQGLVPVFVDCEIGTYNIDVKQIEAAVSPKTKAIFLAHTLGNMFDMDAVTELCKKHNLWLIEDSCDALGAEWNGKKAGTIGHIGTYSFYPAHHMTMGEGGAVVTNDPQLYRILLSFRDWGRDCWCKPGVDNTCKNRFNMQLGHLPFGYDHKYTYSHIGFNLKITDWQAALGVSQLQKLPGYLQKRTENAAYLLRQLADLTDVLILPQADSRVKPSWFGFLISVKPEAKFTKQQLVEYLEKNGVGTRQLFAGNLLRQPLMVENDVPLRIGAGPLQNSRDLTEADYQKLPNTDFIMNNTFWVGVFPRLGKPELDKTARLIREFAARHK
ncbi:MAG: lipopolysaccharide biosynthesis protein RfbH [Elusimicrobia bacterium]|nr:lipopolysaccharide biosynthesis protein RfbH [Elusimicrobiota bacterium]MDD7501929.1 lipopolysaccharide biosynthesis protein RfbH [Elusimicrobiota bacterium]MDY5729230.1 lipopolysaccharide biosynthesis protein RfbH [Elusimicrobiaceae bacterium]